MPRAAPTSSARGLPLALGYFFMLFTHREFQIEIGRAQRTPSGEYAVAWAAYRMPRQETEGPCLAGTTITFIDPEMAEIMGQADSCNAVNDMID